ncbi:glycosyltransferase [Bradyrhizobium liaoningense]|uniref:glycosyltransferase n=1 Tax=Bradyrhizobium liaoningense TaxID=43992 RepID=UPI001BA94734|nr:glycosyltransferase [Bradyrhizobium liaoningense]MBR1170976.1 glycosyltransferase [Bradyrhizobium liaoningense]
MVKTLANEALFDMSDRGRLAPVADGLPRPLWSVMIPTHNCAGYLRQTLRSVLSQDPGPDAMQIEVVDDASTKDAPEAVVQELGHGRVAFHRQAVNVGHSANFQTCLERSRGRIVHLLHGDDAVRPGFYQKMGAAFEQASQIGAAFCRQVYIDEQGGKIWESPLERASSGVLDNWLRRIAVRQLIQTPSIVVAREIYEQIGTFDRRLSWVEDWEMWVRIAAFSNVWFETEQLALYRVHGNSSTSRQLRTAENLRDVRRAISIIRRYLPSEWADASMNASLAFWADDALRNRVPTFIRNGDLAAARAQIEEALRCSRSPATIAALATLVPVLAGAMVRRMRSRFREATR